MKKEEKEVFREMMKEERGRGRNKFSTLEVSKIGDKKRGIK